MPWWTSNDGNARTTGRKQQAPTLDATFESISRSLLAAERAHRQKLEADMVRARGLLLDAILALDGRVINNRLVADPNYLTNLTLDGWADLLREACAYGRGWQNAAAVERVQAEVKRLEIENDQLCQRLAIISPPALPPQQPALNPPSSDVRRSSTAAQPPILPAVNSPLSAAANLPSVPAQPPARFATLFSSESWPRSAQFLILLALTGWSLQEALLQILSRQLGVSSNSGTTGRLLKRLSRDGLIGRRVVPIFGGKAVMVTLSDTGRELVQDMGFPPVEAEWERLQLQPAMGDTHAALICLFAYRARQRGFATQVAPPPVGGEDAGDVLMTDAAGTTSHALVEVDAASPRVDLWRRLVDHQGFVALCAVTPEALQVVVAAARSAGLPGRAADLASLRTHAEDVLWTETWQAPATSDDPRSADDE